MTYRVPIEFMLARAALAGLCLALLSSSGPASRGRAVAQLEPMPAGRVSQDAVPNAAAPFGRMSAARAGIALPDVHPLGLSGDGQPHDPRRHTTSLSIHARQ